MASDKAGAVYDALTPEAQRRTSPQNVEDVLAAMARGAERTKNTIETLAMQRDGAQKRFERVTRILANINALMVPCDDITDYAGNVWKFEHPDPHQVLRWIAQRVRDIPGELVEVALTGDPIRALIAKHAEMVADDGAYPHYCYFELAYTRHTAWMAWLCSKPREDDPSRKVITSGQGQTPDEACRAALDVLAKRAADGGGQ